MNPIAVITGAGQGLGRAVALRFAQEGMTVVLVGRTLAKLESVAAEVTAAGGSAIAFAADVSDSAQVEGLRALMGTRFDHIDILVNCAGEALIRNLEETDDMAWDRVININLKGPFLMCRALVPLLKQSANGSIINILSKVALKGYGGVSAYTASKTGLLGFTHSLAAELDEAEIRVVAICPGPMDTPMRWAATPDHDPKLLVKPEIIAETVCQLASLPRGVTSGDILLQTHHYD